MTDAQSSPSHIIESPHVMPAESREAALTFLRFSITGERDPEALKAELEALRSSIIRRIDDANSVSAETLEHPLGSPKMINPTAEELTTIISQHRANAQKPDTRGKEVNTESLSEKAPLLNPEQLNHSLAYLQAAAVPMVDAVAAEDFDQFCQAVTMFQATLDHAREEHRQVWQNATNVRREFNPKGWDSGWSVTSNELKDYAQTAVEYALSEAAEKQPEAQRDTFIAHYHGFMQEYLTMNEPGIERLNMSTVANGTSRPR